MGMIIDEDMELWHAFQEGIEGAYEKIYRENVKAMYGYGMHICNNHIIVEDAIQDVFVNLYSRKSRLSIVKNIRVYLLISLRNAIYNAKKNQIETFTLDLVQPSLNSEVDAEHMLIEKEKSDNYKILIARMEELLTARQKQALYLRYIEQLSYDEIALLMNINAQSVKNTIQATLKKIREKYPKVSLSLLLSIVITVN